MKRWAGVLACAVLTACAGTSAFEMNVPLGLELLAGVPDDNPLTREGVALGERLFFDRDLSADRRVSCASCHLPEHAFADTVARSRGSDGRMALRNTPSILNAAYLEHLFWDGRTSSLEEQVVMPLTDSLEMNRNLDDVVRQLAADGSYRREFQRAYGSPPSTVTLARALASYVRTLRSGNSRHDRFEAGDPAALTVEELRGRELFFGKARCHVCHVGRRLADGEFHNTGVAQGQDAGRYHVTGTAADLGSFRTPSLRNAVHTAPYMHDGSLATLEDVVAFYDGGGGPGAERTLRPLKLSPEERRALATFLRTL